MLIKFLTQEKLLTSIIEIILLVISISVIENVWANNCDIVNEGLVACYPFDGDVKDFSGNHYDGISYGEVNYVAGKIEQAAKFNGIDSKVLFHNFYSYFNNNDFSVTFFAKFDVADTGISSVLSKRVYCYHSRFLDIRWSASATKKVVAFEIDDNSTLSTPLSPYMTVSNDNWEFVTLVRQGNTFYTYLNGQLVQQETANATVNISNNAILGISNSPCINVDGTGMFNGEIDDLRLYSRALTKVEINTLYGLGDTSSVRNCDDKQHAIYSVTGTQGKLQIPFIDVPLLDLYTHQPIGEFAVFKGSMRQLGSVTMRDFVIVPNSLKLIFLTRSNDPCHALYDDEQKILHLPLVDVGNEVYDVTLQHLKSIPLDLGTFHLKSYFLNMD